MSRVLSILLLSLGLATVEANAAKPVCGDSICNGPETALSCPDDCDASGGFCGDGTCASDESCSSCESDCGVCPPAGDCTVNEVCNLGEDCLSCPDDCNGVTSGKKSERYCCGGADPDTLFCGEQCGTPCGTPLEAVCGNGAVELPEECDDGNLVDGDGCSAECQIEPPACGNGLLEAGEQCDDGNLVDGDGCSAICGIEPVCGNGALEAGEQCDDGNLIDGDGCSALCEIEPECGNGVLEAGEQCDDGNTTNGDGCSDLCVIEPLPVCGNGVLEAGEQCDDGNTASGDGCSALCETESPNGAVPANQFNIGDSIGEAEAVDEAIGSTNHESVWSTGYSPSDGVNSLNERFEATDGAAYYENDAIRDATFNKAISGSVMADFEAQANQVVADTAATPSGAAGHISILLGANDVCADTIATMTDLQAFEAQYRAGLEALAGSEATRLSTIHVSSLPAIYWLWESRADTSPFSWCKLFAWPNVPCQNLLSNSGDDCASVASREDPDTLYAGDGQYCERRKAFHARIRDEYNPALENIAAEFRTRENLPLPGIEYVDVFDVRFDAVHVNGGDCFHPSYEGQQLLSDEQYCGSSWSQGDAACAQ